MRSQIELILSLTGDDFRRGVLQRADALSHALRVMSDEERARVAQVVENAWPAEGVRANVERDENEIRYKDAGALAWVTLAPRLDIAPSAEQWADLATSGVIMTDTSSWLQRHYSEEAALLAARSCDSRNLRPWGQLIGAIPDDVRTPTAVVEGFLENVSELTPKEADFELWIIADRLAREDRLEALHALSEKSREFEEPLRQWRARLGESEAAMLLLHKLVEDLQAGARVDRDDVSWLDGIQDEELLAPLFDALAVAIPIEAESPFGPSGRIVQAINRIGGDEAIRMYDVLIAASDDSRFKFLRIQRDEVVQGELRRAGQDQAPVVAHRLGLPWLETEEANE